MASENADFVHSHSRKDAIADGVLVDLMQGEFGERIRRAGFRYPVAITDAAFKRYIALSQAADAGNTELGRLWDILKGFGLGVAAKQTRRQTQPQTREDILIFDFYCITDQPNPTKCRLKAVPGPDDDGNPCITLMLPEED